MFPDGECPAFLVEKKFVLKFYPMWARTSTYVIERNVYELLRHSCEFVRQHTPTMVVASFLIRPGTEDKGLAYMTPSKGTVWKWPYIISTVLDNAINEHYSQQAPVTGMYSRWPAELEDYIQLPVPLPDGADRAAAFVGKWMRLYHDDMVATKSHVVDHLLRLKELAEVDAKNWNVWTSFESFIMKQRRNLPFLQGFIKALPAALMDQLESYVPRDARHLFRKDATAASPARSYDPVFLHGDLNDDHLLLYKDEAGHWQPKGVIDFGDSMVGDRHYDFVALHISTFRGQKRLLKIFLDSYIAAAPGDPQILYPARNAEFAHVCMSYTLMHRQDAMRSVLQFQPHLLRLPTLTQLETELWNVLTPSLDVGTDPQ